MIEVGLRVRTAAGGLALSIVALLQSPLVGTAQAAPQAPVAYELANGLKVVLAPRAEDADAYMLVKYDAGQVHAPKDYKGLPHLAEHLTYRGSRHIKPLEYAKHLDRVGAGYNGITRAESTLYFITVPPSALQLALWLESDRMAFALDGVTEEALEAEKKTVANEWQERNSLDSMIWRSKTAALYGKDGPGAPDANEVANVKSVSLSDARWFIQSTHRPDNATLVLGGNFDADEARKLIEHYFAAIAKPTLPRLEGSFPPPKLCGAHKLELGHVYIDNPLVTVTWPMGSATSARDKWVQLALASILGDSLHTVLVSERPLARSVDTEVLTYKSHGLLDVSISLHIGIPFETIEKVVLQTLKELAQTKVSDSELGQYKTRWRLRSDVAAGDGLGRALDVLEGNDPDGTKSVIEGLTSEDIQREAKRIAGKQLTTFAKPLKSSRAAFLEMDSEDPCR
jgi:predicted Zn-dependent peptidase